MNETHGLARRARVGISWTLAGAVASNGLKLVVLAVLGRLLTAADIGAVAMAMTVILLAQTIRDVGVGLALVQRKELDDEHVETAFGFSVLFGVVLAGATFALAPAIGRFYGAPAIVPLFRALGGLFVLRGLGSISLFRLQRELGFKTIAVVDIVAYAAGSIASIALAFHGAGPWSLVLGFLLEASISTALLIGAKRPPPRLRIRRHRLRELLAFGGGSTFATIANFLATQGDYVVVGRALDSAALGRYTRAYELVRFPATLFNTVVGSVLFSAFSRLQDEPARVARAYRRTLYLNAVILAPASAGLIVLAPEVIELMLGAGWAEVVLPFRILCLTMLCRTSYKVGGLVAMSGADVGRVAVLQVVYAVLVIGGAVFAVGWGIAGVAVSTSIAIVVNFATLSHVALDRTGLGWATFARVHLVGLACVVPVLLCALPVAALLRGAAVGPALVVAGTSASGLVGFVAVATLAIRRDGSDAAWAWQTLRAVLGRGPVR